ncbi:YhcH/YjgK/YiaL family protein [Acetivibrio ethanolgignens]|uniref:YhcH/YjgK/YiaL family protein n=1 Tax=Acetivibrio ethanolgignens TaxID=290052 RepID=A0A0V8QG50_9FIRM|nr:YhcH/YjgK/YiaL family protein [Acetivibrio ethanolgignens]KSV59576.1 YhcH/YjgK/YiaL family protein [Acetivibrio ethanolgignens]
MIYGNIKQLKNFYYLEKEILACFEYLKSHDLKSMELGSYEIEGKRMFVNLCEYTTTVAEERFWEAHKEYLDIHVMLSGMEQIDVCFIEAMEQKSYVPEEDFLPLEGNATGHVILQAGDFLVCYPQDGHRTAIQVEGPQKIKKAIFKVKI